MEEDSFPPDGQAQSEAAKTQQGRSQEPKVITVSVQEPSLDDDQDHQEIPHKDLAPSKKNPAKKKSAPQQAPKPKKQKESHGPSKKDRADAGSSRRSPLRRTSTERRPSSREFREEQERRSREYSRSRYDYDHYDRDSRDHYREDSRSRYDYYSRDRYYREGDRYREDSMNLGTPVLGMMLISLENLEKSKRICFQRKILGESKE